MAVFVDEVLKRAAGLVDGDLAVENPDEVAASIARLLRVAAEPEVYVTGARLGQILGASRQAVQQRAARGTLLVRADDSGVRYPLWQLRDGSPAPQPPVSRPSCRPHMGAD